MTEKTANAIAEITQLLALERQSRLRHMVGAMRECFHPDATVTTSWTNTSVENYLAGAANTAMDGSELNVNRLGTPIVHLNKNRAVVEVPSTTMRWLPVNGETAILESFMRLLYRVECREGVWKILNLTSVNEGDTLQPAIYGTNLHVNPEDVAKLRISYRYLAYTRIQEGENISQDLLGVDRPETIEKLYAEAYAWRDEE